MTTLIGRNRLRLAIALILATAACDSKSSASSTEPDASQRANTDSSGIDSMAAAQALTAGAVLIDVRRQPEFDEGAISGAILIPHEELSARLAEVDALVEGDHSRAVVVYCRAGRRAATAKQVLEDAGYDHVINGGGLTELQEALTH